MCKTVVRLLLGSCLVLPIAFLVEPGSALRISEKKCLEFTKENTRKTIGASLSLDPIILEYSMYNCSDSVDLIVNGEAANKGEFPHQALLGYPKNSTEGTDEEYEFRCGGSLISDRFVLTAAHCGRPTIVRLAELNLSEEEDEEDFDVEGFMRHPDYRLSQTYHDIALVKLDQQVIISQLMRPACLWSGIPLNVTSAIATGFGTTSYVGTSSKQLMKVRLEARDRASCQDRFELVYDSGVIDQQLCFGSQHEGKDTCQGDSGGPLQLVLDSRTCMYHIIGVTRGGLGCGGTNTIGIYTQVASYIDWIEDHVWPGEIAE